MPPSASLLLMSRYADDDQDAAPGSGWVESTEGDLDPDLTEEAGYLDWEPSPRLSRMALATRVVGLVVLVALVLTLVLPAIT